MLLLLLSCDRLCGVSGAGARPPTVIDIDVATGSVSVRGSDRDRSSAPGSTLKPIVLLTALQLGVITAGTRVACRGDLHLGGRNLACAHPASLDVLDAEEALAYSCNSYFARVAQQMPASALEAGMQRFGLHPKAAARSPDARVLLALGLEGVEATPIQLANTYVELARSLQNGGPHSGTLRAGLLDSVRYGMAHAAQTPGLTLGGKTGTAHDPASVLQHGWFAGIAYAGENDPRVTHVVVVYVPVGSGNDAAIAARQYLQSRPW